jgi:hypothetical protein
MAFQSNYVLPGKLEARIDSYKKYVVWPDTGRPWEALIESLETELAALNQKNGRALMHARGLL